MRGTVAEARERCAERATNITLNDFLLACCAMLSLTFFFCFAMDTIVRQGRAYESYVYRRVKL